MLGARSAGATPTREDPVRAKTKALVRPAVAKTSRTVALEGRARRRPDITSAALIPEKRKRLSFFFFLIVHEKEGTEISQSQKETNSATLNIL